MTRTFNLNRKIELLVLFLWLFGNAWVNSEQKQQIKDSISQIKDYVQNKSATIDQLEKKPNNQIERVKKERSADDVASKTYPHLNDIKKESVHSLLPVNKIKSEIISEESIIQDESKIKNNEALKDSSSLKIEANERRLSQESFNKSDRLKIETSSLEKLEIEPKQSESLNSILISSYDGAPYELNNEDSTLRFSSKSSNDDESIGSTQNEAEDELYLLENESESWKDKSWIEKLSEIFSSNQFESEKSLRFSSKSSNGYESIDSTLNEPEDQLYLSENESESWKDKSWIEKLSEIFSRNQFESENYLKISESESVSEWSVKKSALSLIEKLSEILNPSLMDKKSSEQLEIESTSTFKDQSSTEKTLFDRISEIFGSNKLKAIEKSSSENLKEKTFVGSKEETCTCGPSEKKSTSIIQRISEIFQDDKCSC